MTGSRHLERIEKNYSCYGEYIGYGGADVWRVVYLSGGIWCGRKWGAFPHYGTQPPLYARTLTELDKKLRKVR